MKFPNGSFNPFVSHEEWIQRHLTKDTPLDHAQSIPEFYANREIFITGFSGFIGKVLIEKLLRSCPDIKTIFVLLRAKKGESVDQRLKSITNQVVFDVLRRQNPKFVEKIVPIEGDVMKLNLGISSDDLDRMKNVSVVFHSAASVRFDDTLKFAVFCNTRGTREVMKLAEKLKEIKVVMHVSTTYSNVYLETIEEKIYPALADWEKTIKICEDGDQSEVDILTQLYINRMPNTYVFSKNLAEHVSYSYGEKLPIIIFRPSIVFSAFEEPFGGYVDNYNGPMGIFLASGIGLNKTMYCDPDNVMDLTPVDVCVKAMIVGAWKRANDVHHQTTVVNAASANKIKATIQQMLDMGIHGLCKEAPFGRKMLLLPWGGVTLCKTYNLIRIVFFQLIFSTVVDFALRAKGKRPRLMKIQRKMYEANKALSYFVTHHWEFKNDNFVNLCSFLKPEDLRSFDYRPFFSSDVINFCRLTVLGYRKFLLGLKEEDLDRDRKRMVLLLKFETAFKIIVFFGLFSMIFFKFNVNYFAN